MVQENKEGEERWSPLSEDWKRRYCRWVKEVGSVLVAAAENGVYVFVHVWVSVLIESELFFCSVVECYVNRGNSGLLVERKRGPEVEPLRSGSEAKGSILDPLELKEVRRGGKREGKWTVGKEG